MKIPTFVICLVSAPSFYEIKSQIPYKVSVAIPKDSKPPVIEYPPIQFYKFSEKPFQAGVEEHKIDGVTVKVFSAEKTLVDCFKFRNKIGMDVVLAALKLYKIRMKFDHKTILEYAKICRVDRIVRPYLEAIGFDNQWRDHFIQGQELLLSRFANSQEQSAKAQH